MAALAPAPRRRGRRSSARAAGRRRRPGVRAPATAHRDAPRPRPSPHPAGGGADALERAPRRRCRWSARAPTPGSSPTRVELPLRRELVKPGLTGWAQLRSASRAGADSSWALCHDLYYLKHRSTALDAMILLQTADHRRAGAAPAGARCRRGARPGELAASPRTRLARAVSSKTGAGDRAGRRRPSDLPRGDRARDQGPPRPRAGRRGRRRAPGARGDPAAGPRGRGARHPHARPRRHPGARGDAPRGPADRGPLPLGVHGARARLQDRRRRRQGLSLEGVLAPGGLRGDRHHRPRRHRARRPGPGGACRADPGARAQRRPAAAHRPRAGGAAAGLRRATRPPTSASRSTSRRPP